MKILLGSKSPRRQSLLLSLEIPFELVNIDCEESFDGVSAPEVAEFLAKKKALAYDNLRDGELLITADTTVVIGERVINKPENEDEAVRMISDLSGNWHQVISGVAVRSTTYLHSFSDVTKVYMEPLSEEEIRAYVRKYQPFDKAGAYGVQEWIGMRAVSRLEGSFYNVMGLPTSKLYTLLMELGYQVPS